MSNHYSDAGSDFLGALFGGIVGVGVGIAVTAYLLFLAAYVLLAALPALFAAAAGIWIFWALLPHCWLKEKIGRDTGMACIRSSIAAAIVVSAIAFVHIPYLLFFDGKFDHTILGVYYARVGEPLCSQTGVWLAHGWVHTTNVAQWAWVRFGAGITWICQRLYELSGGPA